MCRATSLVGPQRQLRLLREARHWQGAFLFTSFRSLRQWTAAIVRHRPDASAGGKSLNGQSNPQYVGGCWFSWRLWLLLAAMQSILRDDASTMEPPDEMPEALARPSATTPAQ